MKNKMHQVIKAIILLVITIEDFQGRVENSGFYKTRELWASLKRGLMRTPEDEVLS